jgi:hypothetical protein
VDSADDIFGNMTVWLLTFCNRDGKPSTEFRSSFVLLAVERRFISSVLMCKDETNAVLMVEISQ